MRFTPGSGTTWRSRNIALLIGAVVAIACASTNNGDATGVPAARDRDVRGGGTGGVTSGDSTPSTGSGASTRGTAAGGAPTANSGASGKSAGTTPTGSAGTTSDGSVTSDSGANGNAGAPGGGTTSSSGSSGSTGSIPMYSLRVDAPTDGMTIGNVVTVRGLAPGFVNVEVWDPAHQKPPLAQVVPKTDGSFSTTVDTRNLASGATTWTVWAWDAPPGGTAAHDTSVDLSLTIDQNAKTGEGGAPGGSGTGGAPGIGPTGGRNFLLGMFTDGSEITSYSSYLGYHPEVTYDSSYEDDHHKKCGQPISGLNDIANYPVVVSVFTYNADYTGTAQGKWDDCYEQLFTGLEDKIATIYGVRIDVEFWPHPAASDFKGSFNHIVAIAKKHFPSRIKYIFNPNWDAGLGADYVPESADVVGPDAYNNPQYCQGKTGAQCAADKFDPNHPGSIAYWTKIAQQLGKPMALPEWGDDFGDGAYIKAVADWAYDQVLVTPGKSNDVVYLGYWDSNFNEDAHLRNGAKTVFQQRFANIQYTGTFWGPKIPTTTYGIF